MESPVTPSFAGVRLPALLNIQRLHVLKSCCGCERSSGAHAGEHAVLPHREEIGGELVGNPNGTALMLGAK